MSHLGRPDGKVSAKYSLKPVVPELEKLLGKSVEFAPDCVGPEVEAIVNKASGGQVILLENLRFHAEEEGSSKDADGKKVKADKEKVAEFRKGLTALGDIYISECFSSLQLQYTDTVSRRCLRNCPPCPQLHGWNRPSTEGIRILDEEGARVFCKSPRKSPTPFLGHLGRSQSIRQNPTHRQPPRKS
jgi:hypothetical protein